MANRRIMIEKSIRRLFAHSLPRTQYTKTRPAEFACCSMILSAVENRKEMEKREANSEAKMKNKEKIRLTHTATGVEWRSERRSLSFVGFSQNTNSIRRTHIDCAEWGVQKKLYTSINNYIQEKQLSTASANAQMRCICTAVHTYARKDTYSILLFNVLDLDDNFFFLFISLCCVAQPDERTSTRRARSKHQYHLGECALCGNEPLLCLLWHTNRSFTCARAARSDNKQNKLQRLLGQERDSQRTSE